MVKDLQDAGYEAYIVCGSVRDLLLGKAPKDFDVATSATPEEVQDVFPRCRLIGRRFRLAHVRQAGHLIEVATFRGQATPGSDDDHELENGRILRDNVFGTLEEDALRRDFTINALFLDPVGGEIRDYVGGYQDLADFIDMLEAVRNRISALIDQGLSLEEVIAEEPTAEFNDRYGDPARFINRAYTSLAR